MKADIDNLNKIPKSSAGIDQQSIGLVFGDSVLFAYHYEHLNLDDLLSKKGINAVKNEILPSLSLMKRKLSEKERERNNDKELINDRVWYKIEHVAQDDPQPLSIVSSSEIPEIPLSTENEEILKDDTSDKNDNYMDKQTHLLQKLK